MSLVSTKSRSQAQFCGYQAEVQVRETMTVAEGSLIEASPHALRDSGKFRTQL